MPYSDRNVPMASNPFYHGITPLAITIEPCLCNIREVSCNYINPSDAGGRTVQVLPKEEQVTGQIGAQRITIHKESNVITSLLYIGQAKQGVKHTKNPHIQGANTQNSTCCDVCPFWSTCQQMAVSWASQLGCNE